MKKSWLLPCALLLLLLLGALGGCSGQPGPEEKNSSQQPAQTAQAAAAVFAEYVEVPVDVKPAVPPYKVEPGLANITNRDMFELSPAARELLVKNGFVVVPNKYEKNSSPVRGNRYELFPLFITTDSVLHNYHLFLIPLAGCGNRKTAGVRNLIKQCCPRPKTSIKT